MRIFHNHDYGYCGIAYSDLSTFSVYYCTKCKAIKNKRVESLTFDCEIRSYAENKS